MRSLVLSLLSTCVFVPTSLSAQEMPTPPAELAKFERLLGNWTGTGKATMEPGSEGGSWTATSSYKKAMGGFFIQEETVIDVGPGAPNLAFRSFFGYDRENGRYMSCTLNNMGAPSAAEIHWADDDTLVSIETSIEAGQFIIDRWVTKLGKDAYSFVGYRTIGSGQPFVHVEGRMTRTDKPVDARAISAAASFVPVGPQMQRLNRMAGKYRLEGTYQPGPELPVMEIAGLETFEPVFGGAALVATVLGDEAPGIGVYEAWMAMGWNESKGCYTSVHVNNMGEIACAEMRWVGETLVSTYESLMSGSPSVMRSVLEVDAKGLLTKGQAHLLVGAHAPLEAFQARYQRQ